MPTVKGDDYMDWGTIILGAAMILGEVLAAMTMTNLQQMMGRESYFRPFNLMTTNTNLY